jgi:anti-anti-sigma factor
MSDGAIVGVSVDRVKSVDVVTVDGEVDLTNADEVYDAIVAATAPAVVLDLTAVAYLDSSGIRAIDRAHRRLLADDRPLLIVCPPDTAADWTLRVAGFNRAIVHENREAAIAATATDRARA